jgi:DNA mismatch endonuclease (patch repair protein)
MDIVDHETRSRMMAGIRGKNTKPELVVRRTAHQLGYRFRLHRRDLAGTPDLIFPGRRKVVFVHGCFWHRHPGCRRATSPKSNTEFWQLKFSANQARDASAIANLTSGGWDPLVIWECESADPGRVAGRLTAHLGPPGRRSETRG